MNEETVSFLNNIDFENTAEVYETISILFEKNQVLKKAIKDGVIATCETCEDFGICPHSYREYDYKNEVEELKNQQKENQQLKEQLEASERARKEAIDEIKELYDNTDDTTCYDIDKDEKERLLQILDIDKGE